MAVTESNTFHLSCKVSEVIHQDRKRIIRVMCNPGSLIIETPDDGKVQLGDSLHVTGTLHIERLESEKPAEHNNHQ